MDSMPNFGEAKACLRDTISRVDFYAHMVSHKYIYAPARALWPAASVNARLRMVTITDANGQPALNDKGKPLTMAPAAWLDEHRPVEQMTWAPGSPLIIRDRLILDGGWIEHKGASVFNLYRAPDVLPGDPAKAEKWLEHVRFVYPDEADHTIKWLAHRVQRPQEKLNHALVLGGPQSVGKDTLLAPVRYAVGPWNFAEVSPQQVLGRFNGFLKSVILRISEARDLGEQDRFSFYDHTKSLIAAPPDTLRVDEKNTPEYAIPNVAGIIITTNHKTDGLYLSSDDRRHFVAWSPRQKEDERFQNGYWPDLWSYYDSGGLSHVAAYLKSLDISDFDPKAPPPKTAAFWAIVDSNRASEESELADTIDKLGNPTTLTLLKLQGAAAGTPLYEWLTDRKNRRTIPYRLEQCGYAPVRNPAADSGLWVISGTRQVVYALASLPLRAQIDAARRL
jgi:Family of unknown function (DUF5906)